MQTLPFCSPSSVELWVMAFPNLLHNLYLVGTDLAGIWWPVDQVMMGSMGWLFLVESCFTLGHVLP